MSLAREYSCSFFETSAALRFYIDDVFHGLVREIRRKESSLSMIEKKVKRKDSLWRKLKGSLKKKKETTTWWKFSMSHSSAHQLKKAALTQHLPGQVLEFLPFNSHAEVAPWERNSWFPCDSSVLYCHLAYPLIPFLQLWVEKILVFLMRAPWLVFKCYEWRQNSRQNQLPSALGQWILLLPPPPLHAQVISSSQDQMKLISMDILTV